MTVTNQNTQSRPNSTPSEEAINGLFSQANLLMRCRQLKADIKRMHLDLLKANDGCTAEELHDITSDLLLDVMRLEVAQMMISVTAKNKIGIHVEVLMSSSEDGGPSDFDEVLQAGNAATLGLPNETRREAISDDSDFDDSATPRVKH
jgi:hypothetical protein